VLNDREIQERIAHGVDDDVVQLQAIHDLAEYLEHQLGTIAPGTATLAALLKVAIHNELTLRLARLGRMPPANTMC